MNKCLNESCKKEYESKRLTSKFCSISCRVIHHRKVGKQKNSGLSEKYMIKAIYNKMMEIGSDVKINEVSKPIVYESKKETSQTIILSLMVPPTAWQLHPYSLERLDDVRALYCLSLV